MFPRLARYSRLLVLAILILGLDQLSKWWVVRHLPYNPYHLHESGMEITVIPGFWYLIHVGNTGAAWSLFAGRNLGLALLAATTLGMIFFARRHLGLHFRAVQVSFGLLCGGIAGNLIDRLRVGYVIDFLDFHFPHYVYPTFNVADSGIVCGVILYVWLSLVKRPVS